MGKQIIKSLRNDVKHLQTEKIMIHDKLSLKEREIDEMKSKLDAMKKEKEWELTEVTKPTLDDKTNTDEDKPNCCSPPAKTDNLDEPLTEAKTDNPEKQNNNEKPNCRDPT